VGRVLAQNAGFKARAMRRGDLRCSILETLVREFGGQIGSEMQLARWAGATRAAVRKALSALVLEGDVVVERGETRRAGSVVRVV
jgi:DNA-binding FadR family transcriptional regulator